MLSVWIFWFLIQRPVYDSSLSFNFVNVVLVWFIRIYWQKLKIIALFNLTSTYVQVHYVKIYLILTSPLCEHYLQCIYSNLKPEKFTWPVYCFRYIEPNAEHDVHPYETGNRPYSELVPYQTTRVYETSHGYLEIQAGMDMDTSRPSSDNYEKVE